MDLGGWGMAPRGDHVVKNGYYMREWALWCGGRFVAQAAGENVIAEHMGPATALEVPQLSLSHSHTPPSFYHVIDGIET